MNGVSMPSYPDELARSARTICRYSMYGSRFDVTHSNKTRLISHVLSSGFLAAASTIMIGDRTHDVVGALADGVRTIGALWLYGSREELLRHRRRLSLWASVASTNNAVI